jgi:aminopeptidase N
MTLLGFARARHAARAVLAAMSLAPIACVHAATPYSFDATPGRLPKIIVPRAYTLALTPEAATHSLHGIEAVTLEFREASATIVFNSLNERLADVRLDGRPAKSVSSDDTQQLTTVTLASPAPSGLHTLTFSYDGRIESGPQGLFAQPFVKPGGASDVLLSTQFEATDARRMFPCWDEPAFRATFELTVTLPSSWVAVSNMPIARVERLGQKSRVHFQRTPSMPSYLVHLTAGDLAVVSGRSGATRLGVWAVRGQEQFGAVALANAAQILADYNDYFGVPFPLPKLDSIAVPGGFLGAMEDWGSISYNDQALLITPSSTLDDRQDVFSIQAHEMAHQWHGDLVTMGWWDDIWLNESFASWRAAQETELRNPDWRWWEHEDGSKESAMAADARVSAHAIEQHVTDELQAVNAFDEQITYDKGQAVLRMLEAHLGSDTFRAGVRRLVKERAYSNASTADLWNALSAASGRDVGAVAASWTQQPGFPLISAVAHCDASGSRTVDLTQRRFLLQGGDPAGASRWQVPLLIRSGADGAVQPVLLARDGQTVPAGRCGQALSVNAGAVGYYRTQYDAATLRANTAQFAQLPAGDRIALLDDQWALVGSGEQPLASYLALAGAMGDDQNERAWSQIAAAFSTIEYDARGMPGHDAFAAYASALLRRVADRLGWEAHASETAGIQKLRRTLLAALGEWGDEATIGEARRRFAAFRADRNALRADDQGLVLSIVARYADAATFGQLRAIARSARNETELRRYYTALMGVRDAQLAADAVAIALSTQIPPQADGLRWDLIASLQPEHPQLAWDAFAAHGEQLVAPLQPFGPIYMAQYAPEIFWNSVPVDQLESWVKAHAPAEMNLEIARGMEAARFRLDLKARLNKAVSEFAATKS